MSNKGKQIKKKKNGTEKPTKKLQPNKKNKPTNTLSEMRENERRERDDFTMDVEQRR